MKAPIIETIKPNFTKIYTDKGAFWYSYRTCIAFKASGKTVIRENEWGPTTGKHLNYVHPNHDIRVTSNAFEAALESL